MNYDLEDFNFELPEELIAQNPLENRDDSRLFILNKKSSEFQHSYFSHIKEFLRDGDLLVFNNAKVIHARIYCKRKTGAKFEMILTNRISENRWLVLTNRTKRLKIDEEFISIINNKIYFKIVGRQNEYLEIVSSEELTDDLLKSIGEIPLPPYIKRKASKSDDERYQTVYASESGAVAAPTAGLHFTKEIISDFKKAGVDSTFVTLYVSWGTFQPVRDNELSKHDMHSERYNLPEESAKKINDTRKNGGRVIAVGTTSLRVLESTFNSKEGNISGYGETNIFIYPPYKIKSIDGIITNFHTPHSTLLMLVSAFAGYKKIMDAYKCAVDNKYRFFSYGDAMLIL